ncbi:MAG: PP2C family protein-serine/threonine phosphatase [Acidimicrobiia bacterium]
MNEGLDLAAELRTVRAALDDLNAERERMIELLLEMPRLLADPDPESLVAGVADACRTLAGARFAMYVPVEGDMEPLLVGMSWDDFAERPDVGQAPLLSGPRLHGQTHLVDDVAAWARDDSLSRAYGTLSDGRLVRSWLITPVSRADGEVAGVLYLGHPRPHVFSSEDQGLVAGFAQHLGSALSHAAVAAERDRLVAALEGTLLPPVLPRIPGVDLAARYRAAGFSDIGGDFYDAFRYGRDEPGSWAVVVGDVAGSGPEAAAMTGIARYSIRAIVSDVGGPAEVLSRLNEALLRQNAVDRFLTAVLARLKPHPDRVDVELAGGGHPPALVLRDADESVTVLDQATGTLLGVLAGVDVRDVRITLAPGDALVLYTDGVVEARNQAGEQFGQDRLVRLLATCAGRSAAGIARRIEVAALAHSPELADDLAIVVVRATGRLGG